jgi:hypothetical protein
MADTAAHLVDRVLPEVPIRQWVLSLPFALRYRLAYDAPLASAVLGLFVRTVFASLRRRARSHWKIARAQCGAVTVVQRFGDALNLNVHFHSLVLDGVYAVGPSGALRFHPLPPPDDTEVGRVAGQVVQRIVRLLERSGLAPDADSVDADPLPDKEPLLALLYAASVAGHIATGRRAGQRVLRVGDRIDVDDLSVLEGNRCASVGGVSLHADVAVPARDRRRLERLARYVARPPVSTQRLSRLDDGRLLYRLKHRWRDGTTHVVFEPLELLEKLAALVPPRRFHRVPLPRDPRAVRQRTPPRRAGRGGAGPAAGRGGAPRRSRRGRRAGGPKASRPRFGSAAGPDPGRHGCDGRRWPSCCRSLVCDRRHAAPFAPPRLGRPAAAGLRGRRARVPPLWGTDAPSRSDPRARRDTGHPRVPGASRPRPTDGRAAA